MHLIVQAMCISACGLYTPSSSIARRLDLGPMVSWYKSLPQAGEKHWDPKGNYASAPLGENVSRMQQLVSNA